jgi:hypothetical protein
VWQRGTGAMTVSSSGLYVGDGWRALFTGSATASAQRGDSNFNGTNFGLLVTGATSNTDIKIGQRIGSYVAAPLSAFTVSTSCLIASADIRAAPGVAPGINANSPPPELRPISSGTICYPATPVVIP